MGDCYTCIVVEFSFLNCCRTSEILLFSRKIEMHTVWEGSKLTLDGNPGYSYIPIGLHTHLMQSL